MAQIIPSMRKDSSRAGAGGAHGHSGGGGGGGRLLAQARGGQAQYSAVQPRGAELLRAPSAALSVAHPGVAGGGGGMGYAPQQQLQWQPGPAPMQQQYEARQVNAASSRLCDTCKPACPLFIVHADCAKS